MLCGSYWLSTARDLHRFNISHLIQVGCQVSEWLKAGEDVLSIALIYKACCRMVKITLIVLKRPPGGISGRCILSRTKTSERASDFQILCGVTYRITYNRNTGGEFQAYLHKCYF